MWFLRYAIPKTKKQTKNKKRQKNNKKADEKNSQMFLLYPQYLKLQSWFSIDLVWDFFFFFFFFSAIVILFYCFAC